MFNQSFAQSYRDAKAASVLGRVLDVQGAAGSKASQDPSQIIKDLQHAALIAAPTPGQKKLIGDSIDGHQPSFLFRGSTTR